MVNKVLLVGKLFSTNFTAGLLLSVRLPHPMIWLGHPVLPELVVLEPPVCLAGEAAALDLADHSVPVLLMLLAHLLAREQVQFWAELAPRTVIC